MLIDFSDKKLRLLYTQFQGAEDYPTGIAEAFVEKVQIIYNAKDERDLYALKSLHYEKLSGKRGKLGERSIKLNNQWRVIIKPQVNKVGKLMLIISITNHYE
ncbi:MAG: type II toxin-antitoxin system RelE/ParE family toxin [Candidatus Omnitrophica bacterium]|nr:type II toxin-antitoxin system RelE/ParE family toxin [Candidatus Omnitrophota bacterium]